MAGPEGGGGWYEKENNFFIIRFSAAAKTCAVCLVLLLENTDLNSNLPQGLSQNLNIHLLTFSVLRPSNYKNESCKQYWVYSK